MTTAAPELRQSTSQAAASHSLQQKPRKRKWQLLVGRHSESLGLKRDEHGKLVKDEETGKYIDLGEKLYTPGQIVESELDLDKLFNANNPGLQKKFREVYDTEYPVAPQMTAEQMAQWRAELEAQWRAEFEQRLRQEQLPAGPGAPSQLPSGTPTVKDATELPTSPAKVHRSK